MLPPEHDIQLSDIYSQLGITQEHLSRIAMPFCAEVELSRLTIAQLDSFGRPLVVSGDTAKAWRAMADEAARSRIVLDPFSGFRSYRYQMGVIQAKLSRGELLVDVLKVLAVPGYSEHHTGEAIDITTSQNEPGSEDFANTPAYQWLKINANKFGFHETFPPDNIYGIVYEPWHWRYQPSR